MGRAQFLVDNNNAPISEILENDRSSSPFSNASGSSERKMAGSVSSNAESLTMDDLYVFREEKKIEEKKLLLEMSRKDAVLNEGVSIDEDDDGQLWDDEDDEDAL